MHLLDVQCECLAAVDNVVELVSIHLAGGEQGTGVPPANGHAREVLRAVDKLSTAIGGL